VLTIEFKRESPNRDIQWKAIGNITYKYRSPAITYWYKNGRKWIEEYRVNGKLHRNSLEGPAYTRWHGNGQKYYEAYWVDGKQVNIEDFQC